MSREDKFCARAITIRRFSSQPLCQMAFRDMPETQKKCVMECGAVSHDGYPKCLDDCGVPPGDK